MKSSPFHRNMNSVIFFNSVQGRLRQINYGSFEIFLTFSTLKDESFHGTEIVNDVVMA